ncbi:MAG TPA: haloacid dehalogenase type II [Terriglobales bacterium]|nr:haloacid dehalogenase type II [Terriglobales bacterium]
MLDLTRFKVLTFDCYGTMIDWETGIFSALRPILAGHNQSVPDLALLELYSELELKAEQGEYLRYREVLQSVVRGFGERLGFSPTDAEVRSLPESLANWQPFPDTVEALRKLKSRYQLAVMSNVDDDLFAATAPKLGVAFDHVITAQQAGCYKPCMRMFKLAEERIGVSREHWLHVGQSVYHDVIPARSLGIATIWVNRPSPRPGAGAAIAAVGKPDLEVPDLSTLADLATGKII